MGLFGCITSLLAANLNANKVPCMCVVVLPLWLSGHVPMLADPTFAEMVQAIGEASLGADEKTIWHLTKVRGTADDDQQQDYNYHQVFAHWAWRVKYYPPPQLSACSPESCDSGYVACNAWFLRTAPIMGVSMVGYIAGHLYGQSLLSAGPNPDWPLLWNRTCMWHGLDVWCTHVCQQIYALATYKRGVMCLCRCTGTLLSLVLCVRVRTSRPLAQASSAAMGSWSTWDR